MLPRLVAMLEETSWPARKAAVYALGCALRSSAPVQRAFGRRGMAALSKLAAAALDDAGNQQAWAVADKVAALIGDLVQEGRAVPPDASAATPSRRFGEGAGKRSRATAPCARCWPPCRTAARAGVPVTPSTSRAPDGVPATSAAATSCNV